MKSRALAILCLCATVLLFRGARAEEPRPRFEVVSLKVASNGATKGLTERRLEFRPGGRFSVNGITLRQLILLAYRSEIMPSELSGGPDWWTRDAYNINARAGDESLARAATARDQSRLLESMVLSLLEDRFRVRVRREQHEANIWALTIATSGVKLARATNPTCAPDDSPGPHCHSLSGGVSQGFVGESVTTADIARAMQEAVLLERVVDRTGLTGTFDINVKWTGNAFLARADPNAPNPGESQSGDGSDAFTALQEQAGLRLQRQKGPANRLIVESVDHPVTD
jgi:uncharacterized protein (TIGR03435 family)